MMALTAVIDFNLILSNHNNKKMGNIFATAMSRCIGNIITLSKIDCRQFMWRDCIIFSVVAVFFAVDVIFCSDKRRDDNCQPLQKITFEFPVGKYSRLSLGLLMARVSCCIQNFQPLCMLFSFFVVDSLFQFFIDHLFQLDSVRAFSIIVSFYRCTIRTNRSPFVQQILWMK